MAARNSSDDKTRLKAERESRGLRQEDLADLAGVAPGTICNIEQRRRPGKVQLQVLMRCAVVLGCSVNDLIDDEDWNFTGRRLAPATPPFTDPTEHARKPRCPRCGGATRLTGQLKRHLACVTCGQKELPLDAAIFGAAASIRRKAA